MWAKKPQYEYVTSNLNGTLTSVVWLQGVPRKVPGQIASTELAKVKVSHPLSSHQTSTGLPKMSWCSLKVRHQSCHRNFWIKEENKVPGLNLETQKQPLLKTLEQTSPTNLWDPTQCFSSAIVSPEFCLWTCWFTDLTQKGHILVIVWNSPIILTTWISEYVCHMCSIHKFSPIIWLLHEFCKKIDFLKIWKFWDICAWWVHDQNIM